MVLREMLQKNTFNYKKRILLAVWKWWCYKCYECTGDDSFAHAKERYMGKFDSEEAFADYIISECYDLDSMMGELSFYFDYEGYARYLFSSSYTFCDGYVFNNY